MQLPKTSEGREIIKLLRTVDRIDHGEPDPDERAIPFDHERAHQLEDEAMIRFIRRIDEGMSLDELMRVAEYFCAFWDDDIERVRWFS